MANTRCAFHSSSITVMTPFSHLGMDGVIFFKRQVYFCHMLPILLVQTVIAWVFAWMLYNVGMSMFNMTSVTVAMDRFQKAPAQGSLIEKYFYGWSFPINLTVMRKVVALFGDRLVTLWYRASGIFFLVCTLLFGLGPIIGIIAVVAS